MQNDFANGVQQRPELSITKNLQFFSCFDTDGVRVAASRGQHLLLRLDDTAVAVHDGLVDAEQRQRLLLQPQSCLGHGQD